eukprot:s671_g9.t1
MDALLQCRARVLTCGPTNVAACEIAKRAWEMAEDKTLNFGLQVAELCIVASEERVGISLDHPLSDIMLDHRKKRVKRAAKDRHTGCCDEATLRELVPALYEVLQRPRWAFRTWRKLSLEEPKVIEWPHFARTTARELVSLEQSGRVPEALAKEDVPQDTDEECRNFLVKLLEAVEDILHWQLEHLRKSGLEGLETVSPLAHALLKFNLTADPPRLACPRCESVNPAQAASQSFEFVCSAAFRERAIMPTPFEAVHAESDEEAKNSPPSSRGWMKKPLWL